MKKKSIKKEHFYGVLSISRFLCLPLVSWQTNLSSSIEALSFPVVQRNFLFLKPIFIFFTSLPTMSASSWFLSSSSTPYHLFWFFYTNWEKPPSSQQPAHHLVKLEMRWLVVQQEKDSHEEDPVHGDHTANKFYAIINFMVVIKLIFTQYSLPLPPARAGQPIPIWSSLTCACH